VTGHEGGAHGIEPLIVEWCVRHLGSPPAEQFFGVQRLSAVHGLRLDDGREVVLKVRGALDRQAACTVVHEAMWQAGIPCPQPLAGPAPLAEGEIEVLAAGGEGNELVDARTRAVNAETWEGEGIAAVGTLGAAGYGRVLARMVAAAPPVTILSTLAPPTPWLNWDHGVPGRTWPPPASDRWDPHRIEGDLDPLVHEVARRARARLLAPDVAALPPVAAHGDFEAQNCRWVDDQQGSPRLVIHDWDSVVAMPEAVLAGNSAFTYVSVLDCEISSIAQNDAFLAAYADERGRPWSELEWQVAHAAGAWVGAYNAAFEHLKGGPGPVTAGLHLQAAERLGRAGA
jgi:Ser/Thr protein kinase RdoA (MazF antagonist)